MRQVKTEPKPVQIKEPSTHTCAPKVTNQANDRQPRGVEERPKHNNIKKPPTGRQAREKGVRIKAHNEYQPNGKISPGRERQAPKHTKSVNPKGRKHGKRETGPRHTTSINPTGCKPKGEGDRPKAHNVYHPKGNEPVDKGMQPSRDSG